MNQDNMPFGNKGWNPDRLKSLTSKTYVITGANSGAGFEATKIFISKGAKVVMLCRNAQKANAAIAKVKQQYPDAELSYVPLDLASLDSVRKAAKSIKKLVTKIDAFICNAAVAQVAKQEITIDGFESQMGINHYGHFLLTGLLFELIEASRGRIVIVGSLAYKMGLKRIKFEDLNFDQKYTAWDSYAQSKLAQMIFGYELQRRIQESGKKVQVQVCHPGAAKTNLLKDTASTFNKILWTTLSHVIAQSAEKGAWPEVLCATEENLDPESFYGPTKRGEMVGAIGKCRLLPHALDRQMAKELWDKSEELTGFKWSA